MDAPPAFRQQLLAAIPRLRRYARSVVHETQTADDLVQTTLERALTRWRQFDDRRDLVVWLVGIAHHAWLDEHRRHGRVSVVDPQVAADDQDARRADPGADVGLRLDLVAALQALPEAQREVLLLVGVEQFSYAECAQALAIPIGTVMSRLSRGRTALRAWLDGGAAQTSEVPEAAARDGSPSLRRVV